MKRITHRSVAFAATLILAFASLAMSAPKRELSSKYLTVEGRVLQIDQEARTMVIADMWSDKLYVVNVPQSETFKITFGINMKVPEPVLGQAHRNDRVRVRGVRSRDHLAHLEDGAQVVAMTAAH